MHNVFYDPKTMDLAAIRAEAEKRQRGDNISKTPERTVIHFHRYEEACVSAKDPMLNREHEEYSTFGAKGKDGSQ